MEQEGHQDMTVILLSDTTEPVKPGARGTLRSNWHNAVKTQFSLSSIGQEAHQDMTVILLSDTIDLVKLGGKKT